MAELFWCGRIESLFEGEITMNIGTLAIRSLPLVACGLLPATTYAGALYFYELGSASESSYAGAGMVARANDAGTVFTNPAGMTRFNEAEIMAGATGVFIDADFDTGPGTSVEGSSRGINHRVVPGGLSPMCGRCRTSSKSASARTTTSVWRWTGTTAG
jgi:long-subunit fatty acid transport protein